MTLTIIISDKCKQVINLSEKAIEKKSEKELYEMAQGIANDISKGSYEKIQFS